MNIERLCMLLNIIFVPLSIIRLLIKLLKGRNGYRLRVGDYRVIFDGNGNIIL